MTGHPPATHNNRHQVTFGLFAHTFSGGLGTKHPYNYTISHVTHWLYLLLAQFASLLSFLITIMLWKRSRNQHEILHSVGFPSISIFFSWNPIFVSLFILTNKIFRVLILIFLIHLKRFDNCNIRSFLLEKVMFSW